MALKKTKSKRKAKETAGSREWLGSLDEVCAFFQIPRRSYLRRAEVPGYPRKRRKGYFIPEVREFLEKSGLLDEEKDERLNKDAELAKAARMRWMTAAFELKEKQKKVVNKADHEAEMRELAQIFLQGLSDFREQVAARLRTPEAMLIADRICESVRVALADRVEGIINENENIDVGA